MKKVIYSKPYSYLVIEHENRWYLTFFTGGPVELDICVELNPEERRLIEDNGESQIQELISSFSKNRDSIKNRRIVPSVRP